MKQVQTKFTTPYEPGQDAEGWLKIEIPNWDCVELFDANGAHRFKAYSPTVEHDGITISADTPEQIVERVRTLERIIAWARAHCGDGAPSKLPVTGHVIGKRISLVREPAPEKPAAPTMGAVLQPAEAVIPVPAPKPAPVQLRPKPAPPAALPAPTELGAPVQHSNTREIARAQGFTGNPCPTCGSLRMVRNGSCECCRDCGATTGCS